MKQKVRVQLPSVTLRSRGKESILVAKILERPALVLNRNWQPVNVATVARVLVLLWNESARFDFSAGCFSSVTQLMDENGQREVKSDRSAAPCSSKNMSPECAGFAREPAKLEDQVRFLAATL